MSLHRIPLAATPASPTTPAPAIGASDFRQAMRHLAGGVSIITAGSPGLRSGLTATSVTALAAEPATLIVCVNRTSSTFPILESAGRFAVNVLPEHRLDVAERFSGRDGSQGEARYAGADWTVLATGAPVLTDALVALDCEVEEIITRHSHGIVIGRVAAVLANEDGSGLAYWRGAYRRLGDLEGR